MRDVVLASDELDAHGVAREGMSLMALDRTSRVNQRLVFTATLPLKALPRFTAVDLLGAVNGLLDGSGIMVELDPEFTTFEDEGSFGGMWHRRKSPPRVGLVVNGVTLSIQGHDRPGFGASELGELEDGVWPECRARIGRARAHLTITEARTTGGADLDHNYDRATAVTLVAHAAARLTEAVGVVWHPSRRAMPVEELARLVAALADGQAPVPLWLGRVEGSAATGHVATRGLYPLLGAEIEVSSADLARESAYEVAVAVAVEILESAKPPAHGALLAYDRETAFRVRHRPYGEDGAIPAVVLTHVPLPTDLDIAAGAA